MSNYIKELQLAGLLHDTGKFIRKYNGGLGKHAILSGVFLNNHKEELAKLGIEVDTLIGLVTSHHEYSEDDFSSIVGKTIEPDVKSLAVNVNEVYKKAENVNKELVKIITLADSLSASSDRYSETNGNNGASAAYAPLWSSVAQAMGEKLAVKSGSAYRVYEYSGEDDNKATVTSAMNDPDFIESTTRSYKELVEAFSEVTDEEELINVLSKYWSTVNANTWRPNGEKIGNTTTSLFDHSKTTAAIAGCLYINKQNNVKIGESNPNIDVWYLEVIGEHKTAVSIAIKELSKLGLLSSSLIGGTDKEVYFMYPGSERERLINSLKELNEEMFIKYGETINYSIAENWKFKNCRDSFNSRFTTKYFGIKDLIGKVVPKSNFSKSTVDFSDYIAGYQLSHFDYIIEQIVTNTESISKLATTLRVFELFSKEVKSILDRHCCEVLYIGLDKCIYTVKDEEKHVIESEVYKSFCNFVGNSTGIVFSSTLTDKYIDSIGILGQELLAYKNNRKAEDKCTYIKIGKSLYKISALDSYNKLVTMANKVNKSTIFKLIKLYEEALQMNIDNNPEHLIALSKLQYLISNEKDENSKVFEQKCQQALFDEEQQKIKQQANVYYEVLKDASRRKRWTQDT